MSNNNATSNSPVTRVVCALGALWFLVFFIYGAFITSSSQARGASAVVCIIGLVTALTAAFWNGAVAHHRGGGEDIE